MSGLPTTIGSTTGVAAKGGGVHDPSAFAAAAVVLAGAHAAVAGSNPWGP